MILKEERILCMCVAFDNVVLAGTKKGNIVVFDAKTHARLNTVTGLGDSILCLSVHSHDNRHFVAAGLANGQVAIFEGRQFLESGENDEFIYYVSFDCLYQITEYICRLFLKFGLLCNFR